ncbi:MAG: hypothetical protein COY80_01065 [Candidatus Pacebacteria bacterium CG_4_10_14_0_8_um_filter_42_14]|nr:MAG: hypothetical protein COY80_01065 [Candidatus Pacebacteria bacterium CG_4_10_14_0_8_um_filter_42_14]
MSKKTFDNKEQWLGFLKTARNERDNGADGVGLFGSRSRGDHKPGESDVDVFVEKNVHQMGEYTGHDGQNIQVVRAPGKITDESANGKALQAMKDETRWVWRRKIE